MKKTIIFFFCSILLLTACAGPYQAIKKRGSKDFNTMMKEIDALVKDEAFEHAHWGILIKSLDTDEVWYAQNENRLFMPASNNKIPTTALAFMTLGPDFRFETHVLSKGNVRNGVLHGDLVVWSNGDPTMYERYMEDSRAVFYAWADTLKAQGIRRIEGNIIGDDDAFDDVYLGSGWAWDYLQIWYAAQFGALQFNENYVDVKIIPPVDMGGKVQLIPNCPSTYYTIQNQVQVVATGPNRINMERDFFSNDIIISGQVRAGSPMLERTPTIHNPTAFYVHVLKEVLEAKGIIVTGKALDCDDVDNWIHAPFDIGYRELANYYSVPLSEILTRLMKRSQNMYAETIPRAVAWNETGLGTLRTGREIMDSLFVQFGIEPGSWIYSDGSGLTRYNYISPQILINILEGMYRSDMRDMWLETFPIAGVDGSLRNRMKGTPAEGRARGKTGTIANSRGLSGYVKTQSGENVVYSFLVNGHVLSSTDTDRITDGILELLSAY